MSSDKVCGGCNGHHVRTTGKPCGKCQGGLAFKVALKDMDADEGKLETARRVQNAVRVLSDRIRYLDRGPRLPYGGKGKVGDHRSETVERLGKYQEAYAALFVEPEPAK